MDKIWGSILHAYNAANLTHILWCAGILLTMLILAVLHHCWKNNKKKLILWRFLCLLPLLACGAHYYLYVRNCPTFLDSFIPLYAIAVLALIPMLFAGRKIGYKIIAFLTALLTAACAFYFCGTSPNYADFTQQSYTESFRSLVKEMDRKYILKEWKEIDFHALEEKYLPAVQEAEQEQNPTKFADTVMRFCNEMHDGHISIQYDYDKAQYPSEFETHEYGLSMIGLDNGDVIAVCTTEEAQQKGINDGTIITRWNGKPVMQAAQEDVADLNTPVKTNQERIAVLNLAGTGGETVEVSFLDDSGTEQTAVLNDLGEFRTKQEAFQAFTQLPQINSMEEYGALLKENFSTKMLNDSVGYLKLTAETTGSTAKDIIGYLTGNMTYTRELFREKLRSLKSLGMKYLVIDLRNNMGGFDEIGCSLCDLLTKEDWYGQGLGIRKNGQYSCVSDHGIHGDGEFADLKAVALTNYNCASAGDGTSLYLSKLPNVTLAGITDPCGCNQETGGYAVLSGGIVEVYYPTGLILDETGVPNVDIRADRVSRNPVEVRIPLDYDAAMKMFHEKEDYELNWAVSYLLDSAK